MKRWLSTIAAGITLCLLAGCDDRPEEPALVVLEQGQIAFGGDEKACLQLAYVRKQDVDEDDEAYVWTVYAPEGGCLRFPLVFGVRPEGAADMSGSAELAPNERYEFEAGSADRRYTAAFEPASSNGVFYVRDRAGDWTDITRAEQ
ncbi:MAG TPA: hypothetical protein VI168_00360 [Croceibacterium sp.]